MYFKNIKRLILSISIFLAIPMTVTAGEPTDKIKAVSDKLIAIVFDNSLKAPEMKDKREQMVFEIVDGLFDWEEFSRRALARNWNKQDRQRKKGFHIPLQATGREDLYGQGRPILWGKGHFSG